MEILEIINIIDPLKNGYLGISALQIFRFYPNSRISSFHLFRPKSVRL